MNNIASLVAGAFIFSCSFSGAETEENIFDRESVLKRDDKLLEARQMLEQLQAGEAENIDLGQSVEQAAQLAKERALQLAAEHGVTTESVEQGQVSLLSKENQERLASLEKLLTKGVPEEYRQKLIEAGEQGLKSEETSEADQVYYQEMLRLLRAQETQASTEKKTDK